MWHSIRQTTQETVSNKNQSYHFQEPSPKQGSTTNSGTEMSLPVHSHLLIVYMHLGNILVVSVLSKETNFLQCNIFRQCTYLCTITRVQSPQAMLKYNANSGEKALRTPHVSLR